MIEIKWFNDIENAKLGKHPDNITAKIDEILNINYGIRDISLYYLLLVQNIGYVY